MEQLKIKPSLYKYLTVEQFAEAFCLSEKDLILTNEFIYLPHFAKMNLSCEVVYQEQFGSGEPTDQMVEAISKSIASKPRRIIAIGGGTILDIAKILALKQVLPVIDLFEQKTAIERVAELILVPTTCGTGSEMTNISILNLTCRGTKKGLASDAMYADAAVLIPELLKGLPMQFFAASAIDALIHAVESSLSPKGNETTRLFGYKAMELILSGFQAIAQKGAEARFERLDDFLLASTYAGIAFGNAGCGAVHALSYPLGGNYHIPHGEANYAVFIGVMKKYRELSPEGELKRWNRFLSGQLKCREEDVYEHLEVLLQAIMPKKSLKAYGIKQGELAEFADSVMEHQGRLMANNFAVLNKEDVLDIYQKQFGTIDSEA